MAGPGDTPVGTPTPVTVTELIELLREFPLDAKVVTWHRDEANDPPNVFMEDDGEVNIA